MMLLLLLFGVVCIAIIARSLLRPAKKEPPPSLEVEQQLMLDTLRTALANECNIRSTIRIETEDGLVITFKLEKPTSFQVNATNVAISGIKKFL